MAPRRRQCGQRLGHDCLTAIEHGHCVLRRPADVQASDDVERRVALSRSLGAADAVIVVSEFMRALLVDAHPDLDRDVHVLSPARSAIPGRGVDDLARRATDPAVVTYAGRINAEKGLDVVIAALGTMPSRAPVELRIAGVVEDERYWTRCQQLGGQRQDHEPATVGRLPRPPRLRRHQRLVPPIRRRGGAVALAGTVRCRRARGDGSRCHGGRVARGRAADMVVHGHNGLHAAPGDVGSWAQALTALLEHPNTARRFGLQAGIDATDRHRRPRRRPRRTRRGAPHSNRASEPAAARSRAEPLLLEAWMGRSAARGHLRRGPTLSSGGRGVRRRHTRRAAPCGARVRTRARPRRSP